VVNIIFENFVWIGVFKKDHQEIPQKSK